MASIDRADPVILGHLLAEHRELFTLLHNVRSTLAEPGERTAERQQALTAAVEFLRGHLHDHFKQEEGEGFLEEAVTRVPRLSSSAMSIKGEHQTLLAQLDRIIAMLKPKPTGAGEDPTPAASWLQIDREFAAFAEHMQAHERRELILVQDGYNEDLGIMLQRGDLPDRRR